MRVVYGAARNPAVGLELGQRRQHQRRRQPERRRERLGAAFAAGKCPEHEAEDRRIVRALQRPRGRAKRQDGCPEARQRRQHVAHVPGEDRAVADECVAAGDLGPVHVAGKGEHRDRAIRRPGSRVERSAAGRRLHDDDRVRERCHDPVALQKLIRPGRFIGGERRDDGAAAEDHPVGQFPVPGREEVVVPAAEHADRRCPHGERARVGGAVDAQREA
jgi:hypothetical protein